LGSKIEGRAIGEATIPMRRGRRAALTEPQLIDAEFAVTDTNAEGEGQGEARMFKADASGENKRPEVPPWSSPPA
jgi:hypothetical protein